MSREEIAALIHGEIAKYMDRDFADREDFLSELELVSDDLTAIALTLEKHFHVKIDRRAYRTVSNVEDYAELVHSVLQSDATKPRNGPGGFIR